MIVNEIDAHKTMCPWNEFKGCYGSRCMAWVKTGRPEQRTTTNNIVMTAEGERPSGEAPPPPEGEGWRPSGPVSRCGFPNRQKLKLDYGLQQDWTREIAQPQGQCGRVGDSNQYW
ncbi:hypothetical protein [Methylorubrum suomiense]|uniref:Uncharacterized protein n=1 Tax=Methylorubrum suomiense TaxID=144191 RepID=A0ABQ4UY85_9HYPH|nr:hypothetical protein [Methylorubrum suomiense]GJE77311.1 hypothetical protein BGCPKDLD_3914 [Methylorubrum suomiense]